ncbi:MAG TPA: hypothetical protein VE754_04555 [Actinomycetota bacterium]|nr:hypothetical protein [Actinomycetota bacterium]
MTTQRARRMPSAATHSWWSRAGEAQVAAGLEAEGEPGEVLHADDVYVEGLRSVVVTDDG